MYLSDSDCSCVPAEHLTLRKGKAASFRVDKLLQFNLKTRPLRLKSLEDIYRHVMVVVWRYMLFFNERSMRCDTWITKNGAKSFKNKPVSTVTDDQKIEVIVSGPDAIEEWKRHVEQMIEQVRCSHGDMNNRRLEQIQYTIQLLELYM